MYFKDVWLTPSKSVTKRLKEISIAWGIDIGVVLLGIGLVTGYAFAIIALAAPLEGHDLSIESLQFNVETYTEELTALVTWAVVLFFIISILFGIIWGISRAYIWNYLLKGTWKVKKKLIMKSVLYNGAFIVLIPLVQILLAQLVREMFLVFVTALIMLPLAYWLFFANLYQFSLKQISFDKMMLFLPHTLLSLIVCVLIVSLLPWYIAVPIILFAMSKIKVFAQALF